MGNIFIPNKQTNKNAAALLATITATRWNGNRSVFTLAQWTGTTFYFMMASDHKKGWAGYLEGLSPSGQWRADGPVIGIP